MRQTFKLVLTLLITFAAGSFASLASAGVPAGAIITYGPAGAAIPTISGGLLIALAVLLMLVAFRLLKDRQQSGINLVIAITAITALATGAGGVKLVADAQADIPALEMNDPNGSTLNVPAGPQWQVFNATNVPLRITDIEYTPGCSDQPPVNGAQALNGGAPLGTCSTSTTLAPLSADYCEITAFCGDF